MTDLLNLVMLICAAVGSMAFGILAAYGFFGWVSPCLARNGVRRRLRLSGRLSVSREKASGQWTVNSSLAGAVIQTLDSEICLRGFLSEQPVVKVETV